MVRSLKSPSFWIALLALAVSLGGTAFAAGLISGKSIRKDSIPGDRLAKSAVTGTRVKDNSLTGADVAESKLGLVPRAKIADRASVVGAARDTGLLGGDPPARYVRYGRPMTAGYTASGAWGCDTGRTCVVSLPASSTVAVGPVKVAPDPSCGGSFNAPTAPAGVVCLYHSPSSTATGGHGVSSYGFVVSGNGVGTWAYTAPTAPLPADH